ncbi:MAG TPA: DUF2600 family protein [Solirubrobacterales bacterium]|jgi:tetraprenyl-beta-curcumene synthase|nr:DUF2600 family protein [Solirubrobacterales bacterium]
MARDAVAVASALAAYRGRVVPQVRGELMGWRRLTNSIPDPKLRAQARAAIDQKSLNVEATAVFATLPPRSHRAHALRAMVALQVAIDYLDSLGEQPAAEPLANGLQLHRALVAAVTPGADAEDWYRHHAQREDGGYLDALLAACQQGLAALPARAAVLASVQRAARRCGEGQSHTHAAAAASSSQAGPGQLETWARSLGAPAVYRWWEVAAGASSSVAAHALIAAAADPATSPAEAELIDAAYFPPIGALTVLLDDLIDRDEDARAGAHSYIAYYRDGGDAANRLDLLAQLAGAALAPLRHRHRHAAILAGVVGFYLSAEQAETPYARPARARLLGSAGPAVRPIVAVMRRRRKRSEGEVNASGP